MAVSDGWMFGRGLVRRAAAPRTASRAVVPSVSPDGWMYGRGLAPSAFVPPGQVDAHPWAPAAAAAFPAFSYDADPGVVAARAAELAGIGGIDQSLNALGRQSLIEWGDPGLAARAGVPLTAADLAAVRANYASGNAGLARLDKQRGLARKAVIDRLAGSGMINSGDLGYGEGQVQADYGNSLYDAQNQLLASLSQARTSAVSQKQQLRQAVINALQGAFTNYTTNPWAYSGLAGP